MFSVKIPCVHIRIGASEIMQNCLTTMPKQKRSSHNSLANLGIYGVRRKLDKNKENV